MGRNPALKGYCAAPTFLGTIRGVHLESIKNTVKEIILVIRVLLITSQLTLNKEMGHTGTKLRLPCQAL